MEVVSDDGKVVFLFSLGYIYICVCVCVLVCKKKYVHYDGV